MTKEEFKRNEELKDARAFHTMTAIAIILEIDSDKKKAQFYALLVQVN